jgi:hypothetical protein
MYIPSSLDGPFGKPTGFQRWVNPANMQGIANNSIKMPLLGIFRLIYTSKLGIMINILVYLKSV